HTRFSRDWSSDVCSSDLLAQLQHAARGGDDGARIELGNRLLSSYPYGSDEHEQGLEWLKQAAEGARGVQAQWFLGAYFAQVPVQIGRASCRERGYVAVLG